ncbi:unnamed protein product [Ectocarpus sp. 4 AP-2014]
MGDVGVINHTIYVSNLNEKIKKPLLKKSLHSVFSQFGKIVDIVACRGLKLKGQAWVVFAEKSMATNALRQMQGFPFFEKKMRIQFAKTESDVITKKAGTYVPRDNRKLPSADASNGNGLHQAAPAPAAMTPSAAGSAAVPPASALPPVPPPAAVVAGAPPPAVPQPAGPIGDVPHNILYATGLPPEITQVMLSKLFEQYPGFSEARMAPGGQAFIEFADQMQAGIALNALNGFKLSATNPLQLAFARKA